MDYFGGIGPDPRVDAGAMQSYYVNGYIVGE
jgi:hypothetical protein